MNKEQREYENIKITAGLINKALADLSQLQRVAQNYVGSTTIRDIYRRLQGGKARGTATKILVHTENVISELKELEQSLRDAEVILIQQAQYYEQKSKAFV